MFKKINIKEIRESLALLVIAAIVGTIVSFVAQLFIIPCDVFRVNLHMGQH